MAGFSVPVPDDPAERDRMMANGWMLLAPFDEPACMIPPKALADSYGLAAFVKDVETRAVASDVTHQRLRLAREALVRTGYFTEEQVGDDVAPRISELWSSSLDVAWSELEGLAGNSAIGVSKTVGVTSGAYVATTDLGRPQDGYAYGDTPVAAVNRLLRKLREAGQ